MDLELVAIDSENYSEVVKERLSNMPTMELIQLYEQKCMEDTFLNQIGVITSDGTLVGHAAYVSGTWDPILAPGYAEVTVNVAEEWENHGIKTRMFHAIKRIAQEDHAKALQMVIQEDNEKELTWTKEQGFDMVSHTYASHLDLSTFNQMPYDLHLQKITREGIQFTSIAEQPDEEPQFWDLWWELVQDVPGMDGIERPDVTTLMEQTKMVDKDGLIVATLKDEWIGLSMIVQEDDETLYNSMTGVVRKYRGKGVALALKVRAIEYALAHGAKGIRTHNDSNNAPMIALNKRIGYIPKPGMIGVVKRLR